jgi:hypothetical protein
MSSSILFQITRSIHGVSIRSIDRSPYPEPWAGPPYGWRCSCDPSQPHTHGDTVVEKLARKPSAPGARALLDWRYAAAATDGRGRWWFRRRRVCRVAGVTQPVCPVGRGPQGPLFWIGRWAGGRGRGGALCAPSLSSADTIVRAHSPVSPRSGRRDPEPGAAAVRPPRGVRSRRRARAVATGMHACAGCGARPAAFARVSPGTRTRRGAACGGPRAPRLRMMDGCDGRRSRSREVVLPASYCY